MGLIETSTIELRRTPEGRIFDAYTAIPAASNAPAVLLLPEMFGLSPAMREAADRFAREGHAVLVPNMFWRAAIPRMLTYEGPEHRAAYERLGGFDFALAIDDMRTAVDALGALTNPGREIVAIGHCFGGRLAVLAATHVGLAGAVSYYGMGISEHSREVRATRAPLQLHYGLADTVVPVSEIDAVAEIAADNPLVEIIRHPGAGHSFCNPHRPMYDREQAELAHTRTLALIGRVSASEHTN